MWGESAATPLLDWLQVSRRHRVTDAGDGLDGLVLLDLPDFDSRVAANRAEADRILELADLFVSVTDPQKYADAVMHDEYIAARRGHADHTIVVLNHADALHGDGLATATDDLVRLLRADGLADPQVVATSATTGLGIPELRTRIARAVAAHEATRRRLAVDLDQQREVVRATLGDAAPTVDDAAERRLVDALAVAAGVPAVRDAVVHDHLRRASAHTGSVFVRWVRHLRPGPLRRLGLGDTAPDAAGAPQRSSLPTPSPAAQAEVEVAGRALADGAARGLPPRWADAVQDTAVPDNADLRDALDQAVAGTALDARTAVWWRVVGVVQWLLGLTVVLGVGWYALILLTQSLQFALPDVPRWGPVPYPFLMIVTGLVAGFLLAGLSRTLAGVGARRRAARVEARLRAAVAVVARERVVDPVREVLARRRRVGELLGA
ncbi:MAG: ABC transporter [Thermoleophilia bacterium]